MTTNGSNGQAKTLATRLAEKVSSFGEAEATDKAIHLAKTMILDTIGVTLAGLPEPCTQILLKTPGVADGPGPSLILGTDRRTSALDATLINGTASHALDYDDVTGVMGGHHSVPVVAPLLALAEMRGGTGRDIILSYLIGVEVEIRMSRAVNAVNYHHYDKGWHPTATLGTFGAAAAAAHFLKLDVAKTTRALAMAASLSSAIKANFGTMTKPLHVGQCARNGLLAALLAEQGFESNPAALEHKQGWLNVFNGPGLYDAERMFQNFASPLEIEDTSIGIKQFPCCGSTHPAIAMMLKLVKEEKVTADAVTKVDILAHRRRLPHTDNPDPRTPLGAKFSIQYATARALVDGAVRLAHFEGDAALDPRVRQVLAITKAGPHPDMPDDSPKQFGAEVFVTLKDGRRLSRRVDHMVCRGGDDAMSSDELFEKFADCAALALPKANIAPLFERLETLDTLKDITQLTRLLEVRGAGGVQRGSGFEAATAAAAKVRNEAGWVP